MISSVDDGRKEMPGNGSGREQNDAKGDSRTLIAMAERIAVVETRLEGMKEDTGIIRHTMHEFSNQLQMFLAGLAALQKVAEEFPKIAELVDVFSKERERRKGAWGAMILMGTMLMGAVTLGGVLATMLPSLLHMR